MSGTNLFNTAGNPGSGVNTGMSGPFAYDFTTSGNGCGSGVFCDPLGYQMDGDYYLDMGFVAPEPGSFTLVLTALAAGLLLSWRRRRAKA